MWAYTYTTTSKKVPRICNLSKFQHLLSLLKLENQLKVSGTNQTHCS